MTHPTRPHEPDATAARPAAGEPSRFRGLTPFSLLLVLVVAYVLIKIQLVLVLVLLAVLFATVIERPVIELERRHIPRGLSILIVYIAIIGSIVLASILIAPTIQNEAHRFRRDAPTQLAELRDTWRTGGNKFLSTTGADGLDRVIKEIENPSAPPEELTIGIVTGIGGGVVGLITVLVMAFYYLMEKSFLRRLVLMQVGLASRERVSRVWDDVEAQVGRWLRGQITLCAIIGSASLIGYGTMGIRFWPLLGLWAGLTEALPMVGPWIGGIPAVIIAMTQSWDKAFLVVLFVICLQATENAVLVPRVMKGAVGLSPLTVFVAILAGTQYLNLAGAFLAIPFAAAVQVIIADALRARRGSSTEPSIPNWRWMRGQFGHGGAAAVPTTPAPEPPAPPPAPSAPSSASTSWTSQFFSQFGGHGSHGGNGSQADQITPAAPPKE